MELAIAKAESLIDYFSQFSKEKTKEKSGHKDHGKDKANNDDKHYKPKVCKLIHPNPKSILLFAAITIG